jgi:hypothetical protein
MTHLHDNLMGCDNHGKVAGRTSELPTLQVPTQSSAQHGPGCQAARAAGLGWATGMQTADSGPDAAGTAPLSSEKRRVPQDPLEPPFAGNSAVVLTPYSSPSRVQSFFLS